LQKPVVAGVSPAKSWVAAGTAAATEEIATRFFAT